MHPLSTIGLLAALALAPAGCDERAAASTPDAAAPTPTPSSSARPAPSTSASAPADKPALQMLKVVFTSEVKNKEPADKLDHAEPGQRVWLHLTVRNRTGETRPIAVVFRVNNDQRSKVDLKIESSWSYRTWAYNTLRAGDVAGELSAEIRDDTGAVLTTVRLPIKSADPAKPLPPKPEAFED